MYHIGINSTDGITYIIPDVLHLEPGKTAKFICTSHQPPIWKFEGDILIIDGRPYRERTLYLYNVTEKNDGFYICIGKNNTGYTFRAYSRLIIISKLE